MDNNHDGAMEFEPTMAAPNMPFPQAGMPGMPPFGMLPPGMAPPLSPEEFEAERKARKEEKRKSKKEKKEKKEKKHKSRGEKGDKKKKSKRGRDERDSSSSSEDERGRKKRRGDDGMAAMVNMAGMFPGMAPPLGAVNNLGQTMAKPINLADLPMMDAMREFGKRAHKSPPKSKIGNPQNDPNFPDSFANRRARELYVGGLITGTANRTNIKNFFVELLSKLPTFQQNYAGHPQYSGAVKEITISDGSFAFVEFWTEELAATVIEFDGVTFQNRQLKIGRPAKFVPTGPLAPPMDVQSLRDSGDIPSARNPHANMPGFGGKNTPLMRSLQQDRQNSQNLDGEGGSQDGSTTNKDGKGSGRSKRTPKLTGQALAEKKARELYVGNLTTGLCNDQALRDLFTPACKMLPEYNEAAGPPVLSVDVRGGGTFAFVEFQNENMASAALGIFDKMEVGGRQINVGRPSGYEGPTPNADTNYGVVRQDSAATNLGGQTPTEQQPGTPQQHMNPTTPNNAGSPFDAQFGGAVPPPPPGAPPHGALGHSMSMGDMSCMSGMGGMPMVDPNTGMPMQDPSMFGMGMDPNMMPMDPNMMMDPNMYNPMMDPNMQGMTPGNADMNAGAMAAQNMMQGMPDPNMDPNMQPQHFG